MELKNAFYIGQAKNANDHDAGLDLFLSERNDTAARGEFDPMLAKPDSTATFSISGYTNPPSKD
ncbi:MAG: hypothetical protein UR85_C0008G0021 [Candidatus Nomurabacteria bacterium GW2011_GWF2_35_66]|uniref:Uncharacterized protein n=1 Tax=Candidatus Nomurabacteria bacterium GW2011_GWE1_35_16 TaxID=1618761 RepID=A0A0G0BRI7_9BACT|nr:MAG: hypothetical protein UR55_C0011G0021 [Candidatus Nomurabacteria bacterium GW2011_GWF1_34_20]KKP62857.1 MAG: hypothetical protein UR57_C0010G0021 [Candidatus Nomurabacteria bacterium GW2011_GWE2_34_25]KKP66256.1 MAG: hypothetical protein UR64_C0010G0021 [Candidatus Nomurabacteria bacterium GW2011_GWE1_35_16]KKP83088.1 MAG: hypothetical protein UR85_C0008G0021 [Candidatus Nomurabacteria bacterium GW2011_GWF2_35_66]HAE36682.1 hypothetical protein [Candidatus Nomurabacteria bacterium]